MSDLLIRDTVSRSLGWSEAHVSFDDAVSGLPEELRGIRPAGLSHSPWELLEHIRIVQRDILGFSVAGPYDEMEWPKDYWPGTAEPPESGAWDQTLAAVREDRDRLVELVRSVELSAVVPHGTDQTYLREILLVLDHTAYHVGQLVLVRKLLGAWATA